MRLNTPSVQLFLNLHLPSARPKRPLFPDPRTRPQDWRLRIVPATAMLTAKKAVRTVDLDPAA